MKRYTSKLFVAGAMALLMGAFAPYSSARAQVLACVDDLNGLTSSAMTGLDRTQLMILCAESAECRGLLCKEEAYKTLSGCLRDADNIVEEQRCDVAGQGALTGCIANVTRAEGACMINPTGGITAPGNPD